MKREQVEKITAEYLKPVYGFALKRCADTQDAEDLSQEIILKVFRTLLIRNDIDSPDKLIWTVAHNTLSNYYRNKAKTGVGVPIDELAEFLPSDSNTAQAVIEKQTAERLQKEIAYLSKLQRRIVVAYYFEKKKQESIADELKIPVGTVKWHLFEAKKELKKGMEKMRKASELKFNPVRFELCGTNGSPGTKGSNNNFFRSALSQNIAYSVWKEAKTVGEIADNLGVSPVYVESEAEYLAEYGFLTEKSGKYLCNILIDEPSDMLTDLHDNMYSQAAKLFANELFDILKKSGILNDGRIICGQTDKPVSFTEDTRADDNFILWSLIPYIAALSGEKLMDKSISFEEAATIRPDGGQNICYASVVPSSGKLPMYFDSMRHLCGPCWNRDKDTVLWQIDSEWSDVRVTDRYIEKSNRILSILSKLNSSSENSVNEEDYALLEQAGIIKTLMNVDGNKGWFKFVPQVVWLKNREIKNELLAIGDRIKEKHWAELEALKEPFIKAVLNETPKHLHKMQKYGLQYIFFSDGWFILHCIKELVNSGKLKPPTEEQKKSLTTVIIPEK